MGQPPAYDVLIRRHALGRFADLLKATATAPAMLSYLDNRTSTKAKPNENYARELMELHTVGLIYTEADVKDAARLLTGLTVDKTTGTYKFDANRHATGTPYTGDTVVVLSLRGGFDGLSAVVPIGDPDYYTARPTIAVPKASVIAGDGTFGLHPAFAPLLARWKAGTFGAVQAVGQPKRLPRRRPRQRQRHAAARRRGPRRPRPRHLAGPGTGEADRR
ncbi:DUF1800 family protein [Dactylosporangium sp. NBC_01737]|uniref:DUF1800 family protein n=1 Tax=Dactylosporangium sp. NBC_01737 TaxID=2975959 RepID=UPI002E0E8D36|nr:DUF1800 family protein [Dactylosporangium sp. NBC_01737]